MRRSHSFSLHTDVFNSGRCGYTQGARGPALLHAAVVSLDTCVLTAEDLPALVDCLPTDAEATQLASYGAPPSELAPADAFQWRLMQLPRARQRLLALLTCLHLEAQARVLTRHFVLVRNGCEQASLSLSHTPLFTICHTLPFVTRCHSPCITNHASLTKCHSPNVTRQVSLTKYHSARHLHNWDQKRRWSTRHG